ncbi:hypothetical protein ScPMuIL_003203 [Solemya velum]
MSSVLDSVRRLELNVVCIGFCPDAGVGCRLYRTLSGDRSWNVVCGGLSGDWSQAGVTKTSIQTTALGVSRNRATTKRNGTPRSSTQSQ